MWWRFAPRLTALGLDGRRVSRAALLAFACVALTIVSVCAADSAGVSPATPVVVPQDRLRVTGVDGTAHGFEELLGDGRAVCFAFLHPACPLSQAYAPVLDALAEEFAGQGIRFVGVGCEVENLGDVEAYRREFGITFPIHLDTDFTLAAALDATITPEVVLVDRDRIIRYSGRIDDRYKIRGVMSPGTPDPELREAIVDLVIGRAGREPRTKAVGCPIDRPERPVSTNASATKAGGGGLPAERVITS
jgi:thiol-disulfide isomerase/thioredoxin